MTNKTETSDAKDKYIAELGADDPHDEMIPPPKKITPPKKNN